jgi:hypothetical protein
LNAFRAHLLTSSACCFFDYYREEVDAEEVVSEVASRFVVCKRIARLFSRLFI